MLKKILLASMLCLSAVASAHAMSINEADREALTTVSGIGPKLADKIITERSANGPYADVNDLSRRVSGIGGKLSKRIVDGGITFNTAG